MRLMVHAELTETGTDSWFQTTKEFYVEHAKAMLTSDFTNSKYFKPGLPFIDQVRTYWREDDMRDTCILHTYVAGYSSEVAGLSIWSGLVSAFP